MAQQQPDPRTVRTVTFMFDASGHPTDDVEKMWSGEAIEYDKDDNVVRRSYLSKAPMPEVEIGDVDDFDAMLESGTEWNLEYDGEPITTIVALLKYLGADTLPEQQARERVANIGLLPAWEDAPADLRAAVEVYLTGA